MSIRRGQASLARHGALAGGPCLFPQGFKKNIQPFQPLKLASKKWLGICNILSADSNIALSQSPLLLHPKVLHFGAMKPSARDLNLACRRMLVLGVPVESCRNIKLDSNSMVSTFQCFGSLLVNIFHYVSIFEWKKLRTLSISLWWLAGLWTCPGKERDHTNFLNSIPVWPGSAALRRCWGMKPEALIFPMIHHRLAHPRILGEQTAPLSI